jgi:hypothetical protein
MALREMGMVRRFLARGGFLVLGRFLVDDARSAHDARQIFM